MAKRNTLKEAEEVKARLEASFPNATIVIEEETSEADMSPYGLGTTYQESDIVRYNGKFPVVRMTTFFILEVTNCPSCGKEMKSAAIGEHSNCNDCQSSHNTPNRPIASKPAYGDFEGTGWMDKR